MSEDVILTGDVKGRIQAVNILPNRILQTIGTHQKVSHPEILTYYSRAKIYFIYFNIFCPFFEYHISINRNVGKNRYFGQKSKFG